MSYHDVWHMPVSARKWWINRTSKQLKLEAEAQEKAQKAAQRKR